MNKNSLRDVHHSVFLAAPPHIRFSKGQLQDLYSNTAKTHDYATSVIREDGIAEFGILDSKTTESTKYVFQNNVVGFMHDNVARIGMDAFLQNVKDIVVNSFKYLSIPLFVEQRYVVRCHANPHRNGDSRVFLAEEVCSLKKDSFLVFNRPLHGVGMRLFLPPVNDKLNEFDVKMESLLSDPKVIFLECQGRFFEPVQQSSIDLIEKNLSLTKDFILSNMADFLLQFNKEGKS